MKAYQAAILAACWFVCGNMAFRYFQIREGWNPNERFGWGVAILGPIAWPAGVWVYSL